MAQQAGEVASGIDALTARRIAPPQLDQLAHGLARELGAEHLTEPAKNPERQPTTPADQIRAIQETAHDLVTQLATATENSQPLREQLAGAIKAARELDRGLTRLLNNAASQPGLQAPSSGGPAETFAVESPAGDRLVGRVKPSLQPATLEVAASAHSHVRVAGLARFFPAHTVHARRSTAVVAGDHCTLKSVDHYHVHRLSLSLDPLLKPGPGNAALQELLKHPESGIAQFQQSMKRLAESPEHRATTASVPLRADPNTVATSSQSVQQGGRSSTNVTTHYLVDESELPVVDLLARDQDLVRSLVAAADGPKRGPGTERFLRAAAVAAGRTDDLALLDHSIGLRCGTASIYGLFGVDVVSQASAVMVGVGNELRTDTRVHRGGLSRGAILADLGQVRKQAVQVREDRVADRQRSELTRSAAPRVPRAARADREMPEALRVRPAWRSRRDIRRGDIERGGIERGGI
jgi:hypothetical protein